MQRKQKQAKSTDEKTVAAQVFLRLKSGKRVRDLATSTPADLSDYKPDGKTLGKARAQLEAKGFRVFEDSTGVSLHIDGPAALFAKVFGASTKDLQRPLTRSGSLTPPKDLQDVVEGIYVLPEPDLHY
jgi:hypothetical protein